MTKTEAPEAEPDEYTPVSAAGFLARWNTAPAPHRPSRPRYETITQPMAAPEPGRPRSSHPARRRASYVASRRQKLLIGVATVLLAITAVLDVVGLTLLV